MDSPRPAPSFVVPAIDISPYVNAGTGAPNDTDSDRARVAREIDEACSTVGFIQILGHGIPAEVADGLASAIDDFFALPLEEKKDYISPPEINRGYTAPKSEQLSLSLGVESSTRMNDFFEAFNIGATAADYPQADPAVLAGNDYADNIWPAGIDGFDTRTRAWFAHAGKVARVLTRIFADALELPADFFARFTDHSLDVLRMNNYALPPGEVVLDGDLVGMGEHTDYGIVTVLWADQVRGLQVLAADGSWNDVSPLPGALLVNLGDLTNRWTNERWTSTLHRVKPPIVDGTIKRRRSAAFFHDGNIDAVIAALPTCVDAEHPQLYAPVTVGEHIQAKLNGSRAGVLNAAGTEREAARVTSAATA
ncbi:isopenicillin N synthase family dioxygenase [Nakamurella deserti]|uniref:isopenicillin N synthase family dioxygenase n=1 Tax=Nakamurella deserti TaxID=2164074 RepID=UPI000DBE850E|nr:2-oxoglutarate and iron-dependent oxygenase domain-containing protein [Nakamurella deserti]